MDGEMVVVPVQAYQENRGPASAISCRIPDPNALSELWVLIRDDLLVAVSPWVDIFFPATNKELEY